MRIWVSSDLNSDLSSDLGLDPGLDVSRFCSAHCVVGHQNLKNIKNTRETQIWVRI